MRECPDPHNHLDTPGYELNLEPTLRRLVDSKRVGSALARGIELLILELAPCVANPNATRCFVHNDLHEMNIMCTGNGNLLAMLDWGDAGWGDPTTDFASIPLDMLAFTLDGYNEASERDLGRYPEARFVWARLQQAMEDATENAGTPIAVEAYRSLLNGGLRRECHCA